MTTKTFLADEDLKKGATSFADRVGVICNFTSPNAGGYVTNRYYDNAFSGSTSGALAGAANRIDLAPFYTDKTLVIDQIGVQCSTAVASSLVKVVIYATDTATGWPSTLLYESGDLDCSTTGYKSASLSFTFEAGVMYWLGNRHSANATLRTVATASAKNLGLSSSTSNTYATVLRRTLTYATAATSPWTFTSTDLVANVTPPSIRFRVTSAT